MKLLSEFKLGNITLKNRTVMAPLTRCRAIDNIPNDLMAKYYAQRAGAGLLITEGTAPSPNGLGYARIPGVYSEAQISGWKKVTDAVHENNGKIFLQIMHTGRVSHPNNMPEGAKVLAPSAIALSGKMYTDEEGEQPYPIPQEMTVQEIEEAIEEYVTGAKNAIKAGFDGVEIHAANGYLANQFISPITNKRKDEYGGSIDNRLKFVLEVAQRVTAAIGAERTGIRISPYGVFNDLGPFEGIDATYEQLAKAMGELGLVYLHTVDHEDMGAPAVPNAIKETVRKAFGGTIIASGGLNGDSAEAILQSGDAELTAFGRPFISNPDLAKRFEHNLDLTEPNQDLFYTPGAEGYTDYPVASTASV